MPRRAAKDAKSIEQELASLDALPADRAARAEPLSAALAHKHYRMVAKAARLAAEGLHYDLVPDLRAAYSRFVDKPPKTDPNCYAKKAIVRALVGLEHDDADFFLAAMGLRQMEPVWGGTADTAADVRATAAMGLVATGTPRALVALAALLYDPLPDARVGAVRAVAYGTPREAELLLRSKILAGDAEPGILGECFTALLAVAPEESAPFVAAYLHHADVVLRELAALALGESRVPGALDVLRAAWDEPVLAEEYRFVLIRAAAAHRSEGALDWLVQLAAESRVPLAEHVLEALALYKSNAKLAARIAEAIEPRGERVLDEAFVRFWKAAP
jgi:HEAT repeat protein